MGMMNTIHAAMTDAGEIARHDRLSAEIAELTARAAAATSARARARHLLRARLLRATCDRMIARHASGVAR